MNGRIAVQMYTLREFTKTRADFVKTLDRVREIGYTGIQLSAVGCMNGAQPEVGAAEARQLADARGLKIVATHRGWDAVSKQTQQEIDFHLALGCDYAAIGSLPQSYNERGLKGYQEFVKDAAPVIAKFKAAGIVFGYHNHAWEFKRVPEGGTWYDVFVTAGAAAGLALEIDTYWVTHAGVNVVNLIKRSHGRLPVIHLKDKDVKGNDGVFAPIGEGNLDWDAILPAFDAAGTKWYCIEQDDCYGRDPFDCLASSYKFLVSKGLK